MLPTEHRLLFPKEWAFIVITLQVRKLRFEAVGFFPRLKTCEQHSVGLTPRKSSNEVSRAREQGSNTDGHLLLHLTSKAS